VAAAAAAAAAAETAHVKTARVHAQHTYGSLAVKTNTLQGVHNTDQLEGVQHQTQQSTSKLVFAFSNAGAWACVVHQRPVGNKCIWVHTAHYCAQRAAEQGEGCLVSLVRFDFMFAFSSCQHWSSSCFSFNQTAAFLLPALFLQHCLACSC
jgi:hypothetical protein